MNSKNIKQNSMVIKTDSIEKIYKAGKVNVRALSDVSINIKRNSYTSITGPSGSGKSTLLHILGCLDTPTSGDYLLDNVKVSNLKPNKLAHIRNQKIGFVFQTFNLLPNLNILKNVELPLLYAGVQKKERSERSREVLSQVGLEHRLKHKPNELSGGERQRTAIARALINKPAIILADEPTGNLDTTTGQGIMKIFYELYDMGQTIVVVTHDNYVAKRADHTINIKDGKIVQH